MENQEKIKELTELLQLDYAVIAIYVENMKNAGYSDGEITIIINHYINGGMLSEIIAPPVKPANSDPIISLQEFDLFFYTRCNQIPGLKDKLIEKWAKSK